MNTNYCREFNDTIIFGGKLTLYYQKKKRFTISTKSCVETSVQKFTFSCEQHNYIYFSNASMRTLYAVSMATPNVSFWDRATAGVLRRSTSRPRRHRRGRARTCLKSGWSCHNWEFSVTRIKQHIMTPVHDICVPPLPWASLTSNCAEFGDRKSVV